MEKTIFPVISNFPEITVLQGREWLALAIDGTVNSE